MNQRHQNDRPDSAAECPYCTMRAPVIWVHGHGQCSHCGVNIDECCRGECAGIENNRSVTTARSAGQP